MLSRFADGTAAAAVALAMPVLAAAVPIRDADLHSGLDEITQSAVETAAAAVDAIDESSKAHARRRQTSDDLDVRQERGSGRTV
ncbi:hypothetical protein [Serinicoccus sediminis]|uniref:hypothetical protein n=1 Tax=Serinicoccus sediminis TaxID=2306021 RepID=UPI00102135C5|nr:hypothetical protein [Serinicoccus sediminis]